MPNILKQIQDLGGFCWDKYITGSDSNNLYINSSLEECAVKQINFNSLFPIETGITGNFSGIKLYTDTNNNLYSQKTKTLENNFVVSLQTSQDSGNIKIENDFNKINFETDVNKSNLNLLDPNKENILIDTSDIPNDKLAKFRCVKFNPNETEETCIKILSTKEIVLKCCGPGSEGLAGPGGSIGLGGLVAFAGGIGSAGLDGLVSTAGGSAGIEGQVVIGIQGGVGNDGVGINGDQGIFGPVSQAISSAGLIGLDGPVSTAQGSIGGGGEGGFTIEGPVGSEGSINTTTDPNIFRSPQGIQGQISTAPASIGINGELGSINLGPFSPINGDKGLGGFAGFKSFAQAGNGGQGSKGGDNVTPGQKGSNGPLGFLTPISTFINVGALKIAIRGDLDYIIYGITGFLNPFNKNDTTNGPVYGTQPGGETPFLP
jgi:hypothetical protein